jgi:iron complex transport system permease protein
MGNTGVSLVLSGVALTAILNAAISLITLLDTDVISPYNYFSIGGLSGVYLDELPLPAALILLALVGAMLLSRGLEVLRLGDETAASLGVRVRTLRTLALLLGSASAAAAVSFAGLLGFVGLIVPHTARAIVGTRICRALPATALLGASLVLLSDLVGRTLLAPSEIPVGILMALIGAPFFLFLLLGRKRHA